ncbi:hypothetical protein EXU85_19830 [Spirosoma sp. KCTC 42546]|nr:hypothetical protein EXU85_19830 [Spirosoma sp. KCTC 42546]
MTLWKWAQVIFWVGCMMAICYVVTTYRDDPKSHYFGLFINIMLFMACVYQIRKVFTEESD